MADKQPHPLLVGMLEREDWKQVAAFLGGALTGLAELPRAAKWQKDIALANAQAVADALERKKGAL